MYKHPLCVLAVVVCSLGAHAATIVDLEDKTLAPNSFYNGADNTHGFSSGGAHFNNAYSDFGGGVTSWEGWSYSNVVNPTTAGFGNQYAAYPGGGSGGNGAVAPGGVYAVADAGFSIAPIIDLPAGLTPQSVRLTNTTYAALSMKNGDAFAKKFGGSTGNDPDFFRVTMSGYSGANATGVPTGGVDFYLADYRPSDNSQDYVVNDWRLADLTSLGAARSIGFSFTSSDNGAFGINTPAYVALDNLTLVPEPGMGAVMLGASVVCLRRRHRACRPRLLQA